MAQTILLIDGNSISFRAFYATYTSLDRFTNHDGVHTNAIFGFNNMLDILLKRIQPDKVLVAFDAGKTTFRTKKYDEYKGGRQKTPDELLEQLPLIKKMLDGYNIEHYELADWEADDIIGTMAKQGADSGADVIVVTGDRDLTQLATDKITVALTVKGVQDVEEFTPEHVEEKYGVTPAQIVDKKGLMGDTSDNYPGVTGIGPKTAIKLLKQFGTMENLYANIDELKKSKMKDNLVNDKDNAFMSKDLARIRQDAPITIGLYDIDYQEPDTDKLRDFFSDMDMKTALTRLGGAEPEKQEKINYTLLTADNLGLTQKLRAPLAFELEMLEDNYHLAPIQGFVLADKNTTLISQDLSLLDDLELHMFLEDKNNKLTVFDAKRNIVAAHRLGLNINPDCDVLLASYLLDPDDNSTDLGTAARRHGYTALPSDADVYGKGAKLHMPDKDVFCEHLARKARALLTLRPQLLTDLEEQGETALFTDLEQPLSRVLAEMEIAGITLDQDTLDEMGKQFTGTMSVLEQDIFREAGHEFNLNSPKQLGVVLFEDLGLPIIKKTKTGYSTSVDVLEQLRSSHPIIGKILQWRTISKLQSTYVKGLTKAVHDDHKIHTRYLQTLTQTGRLSSVDPNMQNIPARDFGKQIRKAFVPSHPDWIIFSSDYSQIELRVLAHISGDKNMQEAFKEGRDIHANTAIKIFGLKDASEVTPDMRRQAKATNFGIVYGISDFGLAQNIGITRKQAKDFIAGYFAQYPQVHDYMDKEVAIAREQGYVETLFHRRRYLHDIHSRNFNLRSFAERTAMNTPIQGSAADIIKIAMVRMQKALAEKHMQATMLLQVHDELIFEAPESEAEELSKLVPQIMDSAVKLDVPLKVESHYGKTWYDAK
ncbi:DNA polymerase I [Lacticaseibacillus zhaodongensis]|uniref:DNA polymerase I n=1 Tax=Lacticaseibacillus zhaodongensis TaxID=2668065 RepID=UPI0012D2CAE8|nr:DNA polymerase I [Lacticaseibacillus zhaodongensis]